MTCPPWGLPAPDAVYIRNADAAKRALEMANRGRFEADVTESQTNFRGKILPKSALAPRATEADASRNWRPLR